MKRWVLAMVMAMLGASLCHGHGLHKVLGDGTGDAIEGDGHEHAHVHVEDVIAGVAIIGGVFGLYALWRRRGAS